MKTSLLWKGFLIGCFLLALLTSCATTTPETPTPKPTATLTLPTTTPIPPTATPVLTTDSPKPTSCEYCLELTFDGERCTYKGPTDLKTGPVRLLIHNESEGVAAVNLMRHTGDETIQDMIDYLGEEPSINHAPDWVYSIPGVWRAVSAGEIHIWEGVLEPGIHTMVCTRGRPFGVWFGVGLTVED